MSLQLNLSKRPPSGQKKVVFVERWPLKRGLWTMEVWTVGQKKMAVVERCPLVKVRLY